MSTGFQIVSAMPSVLLVRLTEMARAARRSRRKANAQRSCLAKLHGGLLCFLLLCSACAETQRRSIMPRANRGVHDSEYTARLVALAKTHPNAQPRERAAFPTEAPSYTLPDFRIDLERKAESGGRDGGVYEDADDVDPIETSRYPILVNGRWP